MSPLRAYVLSDRTERSEGSRVTFAATAREARRHGHLDDVPYIDLAARRAPELDKFAGRGHVTVREMLSVGWWYECEMCSRRLSEETENIVIEDEAVYCDEMCEARAKGRDAGEEFERRERKAVEAEVLRRWPGAELVHGVVWNRPAFGEQWEAQGARLFARFGLGLRYGTWWEGDRDVTWDAPREANA